MLKKFISLALGLTLFASSAIIAQADTLTISYTEEKTQIESRGIKIPVKYVIPKEKSKKKFPLVVMAHGHGGSKDENGGFTAIADSLAKNGIASIRMDFSGCGESTESFTENRLKNMLEDIKNARDFMLTKNNINPNKVALFGYSMGGRLAMMTSGVDSSYKAVGLLAPAAHNGNDLLAGLFGDKVEEYYDKASKGGYFDYTTIYGQEQKISKGFMDDLKNSDAISDFSKFKGRVLVMYGDKDTVVNPLISLAAAGSVSNNAKSVQTHMVKGADHGYGFYSDEVSIKNDVVNTTTQFYISAFKIK